MTNRVYRSADVNRLLDWTESLAIAVAFAIKPQLIALHECWSEYAEAIQAGIIEPPRLRRRTERTEEDAPWPLPYYEPASLANPAVWIMNPYRLSSATTRHLAPDQCQTIGLPNQDGVARIWTLDPDGPLDNRRAILINGQWPFELPIPIYSPRENSRIMVQRGMFTIHGPNRDPIDSIRITRGNQSVAAMATISTPAAVYAAYDLIYHHRFDFETLLCDKRSTADKLRKDFIEFNELACFREYRRLSSHVQVSSTPCSRNPAELYDSAPTSLPFEVWRRRVRTAVRLYGSKELRQRHQLVELVHPYWLSACTPQVTTPTNTQSTG